MGRKAFVNDLRDAALPGRFSQIFAVRSGDDDGTIKFEFQSAASSIEVVAVDGMVSDVSDYPSDHTYFLFTTSENVPPIITAAIASAQPSVAGHSISQMLLEISTAINHALSGEARTDVDPESDDISDAVDEEDSLAEEDSDADADMWSTNSPPRDTQERASCKNIYNNIGSSKAVKARIISDLRLAKKAGFKVGILGSLDHSGIVCISIRITKLGISEEAMNAWGLKRNHYLILLIRYGNGYKNIEDVKEETASGTSKTEFRVALCQQYKPSIIEAIAAFNPLSATSNKSSVVEKEQTLPSAIQSAPGTLEPIFIGRPLNDLMTRLPAIIKYRVACSFSWTGAELFFNEIQAKAADSIDPTQPQYSVGDPPASQALPKVVTADHIEETSLPRLMSLPLAAMQFLLRHLVRCTEFCLVCHCKTDNDFEALKPYVCSKPLCLFQYMALGFGPSIEWEILSQPYVVDLLVSFCYASAQGNRLKDFPIGINLKVPVIPQSFQPRATSAFERITAQALGTAPEKSVQPVMPQPIPANFDPQARELRFADQKAPGPLKAGDWIVLTAKSLTGAYHARVEENFFPTIRLGELIHVPNTDLTSTITTTSTTSAVIGFINAEIFVYDTSFDELPDQQKRTSITCVLDTLPDVMQMKEFLDSNPQDPSLKRFRHRISETALNLLRWIIASNRSCIMQVDRTSSSSSFASAEDRVSGMADWLQFRFAQGAPDKEQRFVDCVKEVSTRLNQEKYPTLFAWHGSPLANWHSILREGLHFNDTLHGRAFGDGVYMSPHAMTSIGYSGRDYYPLTTSAIAVSGNWRKSKLCIQSALALNEVVNAPAEFVTASPHYVVKQSDWIQTRYLFVKGNHRQLGHNFGDCTPPEHTYMQDPRRTAVDEKNQAIIIPVTAISKSRRPMAITSPVNRGTNKRAKATVSTTQDAVEKTEDDAASMMTNTSDIECLYSEPDSDQDDAAVTKSAEVTSDKRSANEPPKTDFLPNTLLASTLPLLAPPSNASTSATKTLLSTLKQTLRTQGTTPPYELGWSISESLISNIYQWIVELHSFDPLLPLAQDMKSQGLNSIVLEIRFNNSFPMSPPFVRVIRPRFLPFMHGGGGHVTAGGALCMELLTDSGWSPANSLESVLLQVRMAICSLEPKPARLMGARVGRLGGEGGAGGFMLRSGWSAAPGPERETGLCGGAAGGGEYSVGEAVEAYKRACAMHGWPVPREFDEFLKG